MIKFIKDYIEFENYPFIASSVFPRGIIHTSDIKEILLNQIPPEIRTITGEVLFVDKSHSKINYKNLLYLMRYQL